MVKKTQKTFKLKVYEIGIKFKVTLRREINMQPTARTAIKHQNALPSTATDRKTEAAANVVWIRKRP